MMQKRKPGQPHKGWKAAARKTMSKTKRSAKDALVQSAVVAERERLANLVPTNWCDPLLTGPGAVKLPLDCPGVERLLLAIQKRIRAGAYQ